MVKSKSAYSIPSKLGKLETHIIVVWVDNEASVLSRVVGLFSGRGYNIESLAVAEVDQKNNLSRITIVTTGTPQVIEQIVLQLKKLVPVHKVGNFKREDKNVIFKEMALFIIKSLSIVKTPKETFSLAFGNVPLPKIDPDLTCQYIPVPEINPLISDEVPFPYT